MSGFHQMYTFGPPPPPHPQMHNEELYITEIQIAFLSFDTFRITFEFTLPRHFHFNRTLDLNLYHSGHSPGYLSMPRVDSMDDSVCCSSETSSIESCTATNDSFQLTVRSLAASLDERKQCSVIIDTLKQITNTKWSAECAVHMSENRDSNSNTVPIGISVASPITSLKYELEVSSDIDSIICSVLSEHCSKKWKMDLPLDVLSLINDFSPSLFWKYGEPSEIIDGPFSLKMPFHFDSVDYIWKEGFYVESDKPRVPIRCAVKCETANEFGDLFIPTEVRPSPHNKCMLWLKKMPDAIPKIEHNNSLNSSSSESEDISCDINSPSPQFYACSPYFSMPPYEYCNWNAPPSAMSLNHWKEDNTNKQMLQHAQCSAMEIMAVRQSMTVNTENSRYLPLYSSTTLRLVPSKAT